MSSDASETIKFGYILDSAPVVVIDESGSTDRLESFCGELSRFLDLENPYTVNEIDLTYNNRLKNFGDGHSRNDYGVECGAITRNLVRIKSMKEKYNATFTDPFYSSEIAYLATDDVNKRIREEEETKINCSKYTKTEAQKSDATEEGQEKPGSNCIRIGVVSDVTTGSFVNNIFPNTTAQVPIRNREDSIYRLFLDSNHEKKIDAIASDKVLLEALLYFSPSGKKSDTLKSKNYKIFTDNYTEEPYSVVVYGNCSDGKCESKVIVDLINVWLMSVGGREAKNKIDEYLDLLKFEYAKHTAWKWFLIACFISVLVAFAAYKKWNKIRSFLVAKFSERFILYFVDYGKVVGDSQADNVVQFQNTTLLRTSERSQTAWKEEMKKDFDGVIGKYADEIVKSASAQTGKELVSGISSLLANIIRITSDSGKQDK